jgi:hypothetical protein
MNDFHLYAIISQIMAQRYDYSLNKQNKEKSFELLIEGQRRALKERQ